ncbi:MAG TPA: YkgJ family cysteine cluster protein [Acidobacteriaceae bacterium]|jgi:Fe-S-cluster containining protein
MLPARDTELVQIVDHALADAAARAVKDDGSSWLACRPGCTPCCHGVFRISMLDAERLRAALLDLEREDKPRADAIRARASHLVEQLKTAFPGNAATGLLDEEDERWEEFADLPDADASCPVLDPATGRCELYTGRPLTCRIFGPPVKNEFGIGICELCYVGASESEVLHGEMHLTHHPLEEELNTELPPGETVIAWALRSTAS